MKLKNLYVTAILQTYFGIGHKIRSYSPSIELTLSQWGGLSTKKFKPEYVNEDSSIERRF